MAGTGRGQRLHGRHAERRPRRASTLSSASAVHLRATAWTDRASNTASAAVDTTFIAATDDDALPEPDWLCRAMEGFEQYRCDFVGGPVHPRWAGTLPSWARSRRGDNRESARPVESRACTVRIRTRRHLLAIGCQRRLSTRSVRPRWPVRREAGEGCWHAAQSIAARVASSGSCRGREGDVSAGNGGAPPGVA